MKTIGIIPCRWGSLRFPGKPLADIHGRPMLWHVHQRAQRCAWLDEVLIATDDRRILDVARGLGIVAVLTTGDHATGTDRVAEAARALAADDIVVNIQGDEPLIEPAAIGEVARALHQAPGAIGAVNAWARFAAASDVVDANNVKAVLGKRGEAIYFSRQPIPYPKGGAVDYRRQLGLYAFRNETLQQFARTLPGPLETAEGIEMLRFIESGRRLHMVEVEDRSIPVDTPADLERVREALKLQAAA